jgi:hypothetical protein
VAGPRIKRLAAAMTAGHGRRGLSHTGAPPTGERLGSNMNLLMRRDGPTALRVAPFLLALPLLVHCFGPLAPALSQTSPKAGVPTKQPPLPKIHYGSDKLPEPVREMREAILAAALSGEIEELRHVYEMNDLRPDLGSGPSRDPVAAWKQASGDGKGLEVLAALSLILEAGHVVLPLGRDLENNRVYVWPYFAEVPLDKLTPAQEVELLRLVPPAAAKAMKDKGRYTHWRVTIGADGSWHSFRKDD